MPWDEEDDDGADMPRWYQNYRRVACTADWSMWEPPEDSIFPTHVVYPVEHGIKCKGHRAYLSPTAAAAIRDDKLTAWVPSWVLYPKSHENLVQVDEKYL